MSDAVPTALRLALYEPDIPQNAGTLIRTAACLGFAVDLIEPAGFSLDDRHLRRAGLDYLDLAALVRHSGFAAFDERVRGEGRRLVLLTTAATKSHLDFAFRTDDVIMVGRESAGVPDRVHDRADARLRIPMHPERRSLNVAIAAAIVLAEALRQTGGFPPIARDDGAPPETPGEPR